MNNLSCIRRMVLIAGITVFGLTGIGWANPWNIGANGTTVSATLTDGTLTISGAGEMNWSGEQFPPWYSLRSSITSVNISWGVTNVGNNAFRDHTNLTSVNIESTVTSIGWSAFQGCIGLTEIEIPNSVISIEGSAFEGCTGLTGVFIGSGVTSIGGRAFYGCTGLTSVMIPDNVISIEGRAFEGCTGLTGVNIGIGVTSIGGGAFQGCTNLESINVLPANANLSSENGVLLNKDKTTLIHYPAGRQGAYTVPNTVENIGDNAFNGSTGLTSIIISNSVINIGSSAFEGCTGLTAINVELDNANYSSEDGVLFNKGKTILVMYPSGRQGAYDITLGVISIGGGAFRGCTGLTSVTIPISVSLIGEGAFEGCTGLTEITIPVSVNSIERNVFEGCTNLTEITVEPFNNNYSSEDGVLFNRDKTTLVIYPTGKQGAYSIPGSVTRIEDRAFTGCIGLTSVMIPAGVTYIGRTQVGPSSFVTSAFQNCTNLTSIDVAPDNNNYSSEDGVLFNKDKTALVIYPAGRQGAYSVPNHVTRIENYAFFGCAGLTSLTIPAAVTSIGSFATFWGCTVLKSIINLNPSPQSSTSTDIFRNIDITNICLYVPESSLDAYSSAYLWKEFGCIGVIRTVAFNSQGGNAVSSQPVGHGTKAAKPDDPIRSGYVFDGWYLDEEYTGVWNFTANAVTFDITLYAKWLRVYNVTFYSLGGNSVSSQDVAYGKKAVKPADPIRAGFIFDGWYQSEQYAAVSEWHFDTDVVTADVSLYAKWALPVTVTFNLQDGSAVSSQTIGQGSKVTKPENPQRPRFIFSGWYRDAAYTNAWDFDTDVVTADITLHAKWTEIVSVLSPNRVIPPSTPGANADGETPVNHLEGEFTAGPNPVARSAGIVNFFYQGKKIQSASFTVFDAFGNAVNKVSIKDNAISAQERRPVGSWDLTDSKGRQVSEGTYLVKGTIIVDGKRERVSLLIGVK